MPRGEVGEDGVGELVAVCTVHEVRSDPGRVGRTGVDKRPRTGTVLITPDGPAGDTVCDTEHHGGRDKAVYAYATEDADRWAAELGEPIDPGRFGENLTVRGLAVSDAVIGERWRVGGTCVLEVTMPRTPCATFGRWLAQPHWVRRFTERGDTGAYLRVVRPGVVAAGDRIEIVGIPSHGVTVREVFSGRDAERLALLLADQADLAPDVVTTARRVNRSGEPRRSADTHQPVAAINSKD